METEERRKLFDQLLQLLDTFDEVCRKNGLHYMLLGGSLLGAVRHKGFIPWDDDLDVGLLREDYDKLLALPADTFKAPYFLQTPATDKGYFKSIIKLRKSDTTFIPYKDAVYDMNHGIFLDIFPLDAVPDDPAALKKELASLRLQAKLLLFVGRIDGHVGTEGLSAAKKVMYYALIPLKKLGLLSGKSIFDKINRICRRGAGKKTARTGLINFTFDNPRFLWDSEIFSGIADYPFEGRQYPGPADYDGYLKNAYGDYMKPVKQSSEHGTSVFDTETPYPEYIAAHREELHRRWLESRNK